MFVKYEIGHPANISLLSISSYAPTRFFYFMVLQFKSQYNLNSITLITKVEFPARVCLSMATQQYLSQFESKSFATLKSWLLVLWTKF